MNLEQMSALISKKRHDNLPLYWEALLCSDEYESYRKRSIRQTDGAMGNFKVRLY